MREHELSKTPSWVADAVFYQIFPDRFARHRDAPALRGLESWESPPTVFGFKGGTLRGIEERLDYLVDLGVTAIYCNPLFQSPANHRYHTHDYFKIDPILGGEEDFDSLLTAAHRRGIKVILDGVFNHVGRGFYQFNHVLENGTPSPFVDWFHFNPDHLDRNGVVAFPSAEHHKQLEEVRASYDVLGYRAWADLAPLPKLNTDNPEVREFILRVAEYWVHRGIDGWRLDVPTEIDDVPFWREFRRRVREINPEAYLVGEIWSWAEEWLRGDRFDAVMNYPFSRNALGFFGGEKLDDRYTPGGFALERLDAGELVSRTAEQLSTYRRETNLAQFNLLGSHDTARLRTLLSGDVGRATVATLYLFLLPGAPSIYYGDEIGMSGGDDPSCRAAFPWNDGDWEPGVREAYKAIIALRRRRPAIRRGEYTATVPETDGEASADLIVLARWTEDEAVLAVFNRSTEPRRLTLSRRSLEAALGGVSQFRPDLLVEGAGGAVSCGGAPEELIVDGELLRTGAPGVSGAVYTALRRRV